MASMVRVEWYRRLGWEVAEQRKCESVQMQ